MWKKDNEYCITSIQNNVALAAEYTPVVSA
jgi:hypothetical protein